MSGVKVAGSPRPPNSLFCSNGAAQKCSPSPTFVTPTALTTAIAATMDAIRRAGRGRADAAFECCGRCAKARANAAKREDAIARGCGRCIAKIAVRGRSRPQFLLPPLSRSNTTAPGTIGISASRTARPRPCSASHACTPPPASIPNAEPPDSANASTRSTVLARSSNAPSRVPGPPPRTSIAATAG